MSDTPEKNVLENEEKLRREKLNGKVLKNNKIDQVSRKVFESSDEESLVKKIKKRRVIKVEQRQHEAPNDSSPEDTDTSA